MSVGSKCLGECSKGEAGDAMGEEVDNLFTEVRETLMISWCAGTDLR